MITVYPKPRVRLVPAEAEAKKSATTHTLQKIVNRENNVDLVVDVREFTRARILV